jgi:hypothetical protein
MACEAPVNAGEFESNVKIIDGVVTGLDDEDATHVILPRSATLIKDSAF